MSDVAVIGTDALVGGFALAGVQVFAAGTPDEVREAWRQLPPAVALVVLTGDAARVLADERQAPAAPLTVVMPS